MNFNHWFIYSFKSADIRHTLDNNIN